jgi:hypothetical protein
MKYFAYLLPYSFFAACEKTLIARWIANSLYAFATIETVHIMGLAVLIGTMLVVDLRLLGFGEKWESPAKLAKDLAPWTWGSMIVMVSTGIPLFLSEATRLSRNIPFYYKVLFLFLAFSSHFTLHRKVTRPHWHESWGGKAAAVVSVTCWFGVALAGRAIAFL